MEEIAKQLQPFIQRIHDNEKAFFEFFNLNGKKIVCASVGTADWHIMWEKISGRLEHDFFLLDKAQEFFDSLEGG